MVSSTCQDLEGVSVVFLETTLVAALQSAFGVSPELHDTLVAREKAVHAHVHGLLHDLRVRRLALDAHPLFRPEGTCY